MYEANKEILREVVDDWELATDENEALSVKYTGMTLDEFIEDFQNTIPDVEFAFLSRLVDQLKRKESVIEK